MSHKKEFLANTLRLVVLMAMFLGTFQVGPAAPASAAAPAVEAPAAPAAPTAETNTIALRVYSARTEAYWREDPSIQGIPGVTGITQGTPITEYTFIINDDNDGDAFQPRFPDCYPYTDETNTTYNPNYPANCNWQGVRAVPSHSPIITQGTQNELSETAVLTLPDGDYLISVSSPDFKIDGQWFSLPMEEEVLGDGVAVVEVGMQPLPLPTATIAVWVFEDNQPTNWGPDVPAENGLEGFVGHVGDWGGEVTTDVFGNPLCTEYYTSTNTLHGYLYDADGAPVPVPGTGGQCLSDVDGNLIIPNMATNRYEVWVVPPDGTAWTQTTTLEGNKPFDTWVMEGYTGNSTEFVNGAETFPMTIFGFVQPTDLLNDPGVSGKVQGVIVQAEVAVPFVGGLPFQGSLWGGLAGSKITRIINNGWVALADLQAGDTAVYISPAKSDGSFEITNVPDGDYFFSYWDEKNLMILDWVQVSVRNGEVVDLGVLFLTGWFTRIHGRVFVDDNENGKYDPGEHGLQEFPLLMRRRENSEMDRGAVLVLTENDGTYEMENVYPINQWIIQEAYLDTYYTTGITYQAFNQPEETTLLGAGVDIGVMPVIGQSTRIDWGVKPYEPGTNGGIAGTVFYDTTRNELDPRFQAAEPWAVGIPGLTLNLYAPVPCGTNAGVACSADGKYELAPDGSYAKGAWLNSTDTEAWQRPVDCQAYDVSGNPLQGELVLPPATGGYDCLEPILMGTQVQGNDFATVDGNFGFGSIFSPSIDTVGAVEEAMPLGDYLVEVEIPNDPYTLDPVYQVVREEDVNVFDGPTFVPQINPSICAGALHEVDVAGIDADGDLEFLDDGVTPNPAFDGDGPNAFANPNFVAEGGSIYEGEQRPLCDMKLITVSDQRSVAPGFMFYTKTPIPGRHWGLILDDLTLSTNPLDMTYGEKAGIPNSPIGIYDYTNRLRKVVHSDPHGYFQALLPSTEAINVPSPSGLAANMYYYVGNDPGQPGALNPYYNPQYRTIAVPFEVFPGIGIVADLAPTQIGVSIQAPGSQFSRPAACTLSEDTPQVFAVDKPYVYRSGTAAERTITITGIGFGTSGTLQLGNQTLTPSTWTDRQIVVTVPGIPTGARSLRITNGTSGQQAVNTLTLHVIGQSYQPTLFHVGPDPDPASPPSYFPTIQEAIEAAYGTNNALVVVWPGAAEMWNPTGAYYENLIIHSRMRLQGVGPGGVYPDGTLVPGSVINGSNFAGDAFATAEDWRLLLESLTWVGNQTVNEGAVITVLAESNNQYAGSFTAMIDGFTIEGGNQQGFPNNINQIGGTPTGQAANVAIQGGGIFINGYVRQMQISNNFLRSNGGSYGGAIRIGTPNWGDSRNVGIHILNNQIIANGGTNLAGAVGIFEGSNAYEVAWNEICGNFSAEYGGAISQYGYSPGGNIHHNRIFFNRSYDEGGAIMIAGELPADPVNTLSPGAGPVNIYNNIIQSNLANDDGGGLRFLMAGNYPFNVYNNFIANNVSTHEGGGISLNDAPDVRIYNNTIAKNITTATALTSTGAPAPAGLSTSLNSDLLQASLPLGAPVFSDPLQFNNIFWDNRAGSWDGSGIFGIGLGGAADILYWDMGLTDLSHSLSPIASMLSPDPIGMAFDPSNMIGVDPLFISSYDTSVTALPWRGNPNFIGVNLVAIDLPPTLMGDYHLQGVSPAINTGVESVLTDAGLVFPAPAFDIDDEIRDLPRDIGADEVLPAVLNLLSAAGASPDLNLNTVIPGANLNESVIYLPMAIQQQ